MYEEAKKYLIDLKIAKDIYLLCSAVMGILAGGAVLVLSFVGGGIGLFLFGAILLGGGIWACTKLKGMNRGSTEADMAYDNLVASMMQFSKDDALAKLGLDESEVTEAEPVCISGYSFEGTGLVKKGVDGKWRSNKYETWFMFFSGNEVHCCKKTIKTTENWKTESTDVYFYKDIVSVSTTSETKMVTVNGMARPTQVDYDCFVLTTAGGTAFKVSLKDMDNAQRSVNAMRSLLRAKKQEG